MTEPCCGRAAGARAGLGLGRPVPLSVRVSVLRALGVLHVEPRSETRIVVECPCVCRSSLCRAPMAAPPVPASQTCCVTRYLSAGHVNCSTPTHFVAQSLGSVRPGTPFMSWTNLAGTPIHPMSMREKVGFDHTLAAMTASLGRTTGDSSSIVVEASSHLNPSRRSNLSP